MKQVNPAWIVGVIFAIIGVVFLVLGVAFLAVHAELLPALFTSEVWLGETPDELTLPMIGLIFACIGTVFAMIGLILLLTGRRERLLREELERFGTRVTGALADIRIDRTVRVNGRSPLRLFVQAQHPYTGEMKTLRGPLVWDTTLSTGDAVEVLFDPQDEKRYAVVLPGERG